MGGTCSNATSALIEEVGAQTCTEGDHVRTQGGDDGHPQAKERGLRIKPALLMP